MMKTGSAIDRISTRESLRDAWRKISKRNRRSKGLDNITLQAFKNNLDDNLSQIAKQLREGNYKFSQLRPHAIDKPGSKKKRLLQIPAVRDRVVMKALALAIGPTFRKLDLECSYAYIPGRGVNSAVNRVRELAEQGYKYYFEADIINFFGAVDREVLWGKFKKRVRQRSLLPLLRQCFDLELGDLESFRTEFQELLEGAESGIPQGGVLSPMLANFYLHEFDRALTDNGFRLVRYADDFVVMCESIERAQAAYQTCKLQLEALGLQIHALDAADSKSRIGYFAKDGLTFLGIRFEGKDVFPSKKATDRLKTKMQDVLKPTSGRSVLATLQKLRNLLVGWGNSYRSMKVTTQYASLDQFIRLQVERYLAAVGIVLTGNKRRKQLKLLGVPSLVSMIDHSQKL